MTQTRIAALRGAAFALAATFLLVTPVAYSLFDQASTMRIFNRSPIRTGEPTLQNAPVSGTV